MSTVEIAIGKSKYQIECLESEKEKLIELAKKLNERVNNISLALRNVDEKTILVIAALMTEGELEKVSENISEKIDQDEDHKYSDDDLHNAVSDNMENVAEYIEKLANKIRSY